MCAASSASAPLALYHVRLSSARLGEQAGKSGMPRGSSRGSSDNAAAVRAPALPARSRYHVPASSAMRQASPRTTRAMNVGALRGGFAPTASASPGDPVSAGGGDIRRRCCLNARRVGLDRSQGRQRCVVDVHECEAIARARPASASPSSPADVFEPDGFRCGPRHKRGPGSLPGPLALPEVWAPR